MWGWNIKIKILKSVTICGHLVLTAKVLRENKSWKPSWIFRIWFSDNNKVYHYRLHFSRLFPWQTFSVDQPSRPSSKHRIRNYFFLPKTRQFPAKFNLSYDKLKTCHQLSKYGQLKMWVIRAEISSRLQRSFLQLRFFVRSRSLKLLKNCLSHQVTQATSQVKMRLCQEIIWSYLCKMEKVHYFMI